MRWRRRQRAQPARLDLLRQLLNPPPPVSWWERLRKLVMGKPKPEYKPAPIVMMQFVRVPREVFAHYIDQRWVDVLAAATAGLDGLQVVQENYYQVGNRTGEWAMLREAPSGGCFLFRQNWIEPDAIVYSHFL